MALTVHAAVTVTIRTHGFKLEQVLHVHHSFAVAGWEQRVVLAVNH